MKWMDTNMNEKQTTKKIANRIDELFEISELIVSKLSKDERIQLAKIIDRNPEMFASVLRNTIYYFMRRKTY